MNRRTHMKAMLAATAAVDLARGQAPERKKPPIQLFVEMNVDPAREREMLDNYHSIFLPEARKHPGFISLRMLKLRSVVQGPPLEINYRFELVYESEELRQKWIASPEHLRVWPTIERTLKHQKNYPVLLFDEV